MGLRSSSVCLNDNMLWVLFWAMSCILSIYITINCHTYIHIYDCILTICSGLSEVKHFPNLGPCQIVILLDINRIAKKMDIRSDSKNNGYPVAKNSKISGVCSF